MSPAVPLLSGFPQAAPGVPGCPSAAVQHSQAFYREQSHVGVLVIPCFSFTCNVPVFTLTGVLYVSSVIPSVCYFCFNFFTFKIIL